MNTDVWTESGGHILKETLKQEARILHQMHQPPELLDDWLKSRGKLRHRLLTAAGTFPAPPDLDIQEYGTISMDGYRITKLTYQSRPGMHVTANLFVPDGKGKFPAILNLHGHYHQGKIASMVAARGHLLAKEGFVVLSVDAIGAGERGTMHGNFEHHMQNGIPLFSFGESLLGMQVYDNMRAIDLLESLHYVDKNRIGVTGASGGGNQTLWISALDPRVKASVPVVSVGTFEAYITNGNCWCETLPDGLQITEEWGILGLIAPNPLLILTGYREEVQAFLPKEMLRAHTNARKIYALYGAEERISCQIIDLPHGYFPEMRRHMLGWFKLWLQNEGKGLPRAISKDPELPEVDLMCFPGKTRPGKVKSLLEYVSLRSKAAKKEFLAQPKLDRKKKSSELARILRMQDGPAYVRFSEIVSGAKQGTRFAKFAVESEPGVLIPCTIIFPGKKFSSVVIAAHPNGK
ncbi:MAG: acetylxylan esterase, partial [Lentisphaerae bacterium]|nr:acetylxylan esterase [Lentisphaerota bacterium]